MNLPLLGNTQNVLTVCVLASDLHSFSSRNTDTQQMPQQNAQVSLLESFQLEFIIDTIIGHQEHVWIIMYEGISQHSCSNTTGHPNPSHQRCQRMCSRPSIGSKPAASIPRSKWYQAVLKHRHPSAVDILSRYELFKMIQNVVQKPIALSVPTDNLSVDLDAAPPWRKGFNGLLYYIYIDISIFTHYLQWFLQPLYGFQTKGFWLSPSDSLWPRPSLRALKSSQVAWVFGTSRTQSIPQGWGPDWPSQRRPGKNRSPALTSTSGFLRSHQKVS